MNNNSGIYAQPGDAKSRAGLYLLGRSMLAGAGVGDPAGDARALLCVAAGCTLAQLLLDMQAQLPDSAVAKYYSFLHRRMDREPLQYILGEWEFMGLPFIVDSSVLIPRQETECLVERLLEEFGAGWGCAGPVILDLCTGSGCIAVSLAKHINNAVVYAADISKEALLTAKKNAELNGVSSRVEFFLGDMFSAASERVALKDVPCFDAICANPPYVASGDISSFPDEIRLHEPRIALDGGAEGLDFYQEIAVQSALRLKPGGLLAVEVGCGQAGQVRGIFAGCGFKTAWSVRDLNGIERVILARR